MYLNLSNPFQLLTSDSSPHRQWSTPFQPKHSVSLQSLHLHLHVCWTLTNSSWVGLSPTGPCSLRTRTMFCFSLALGIVHDRHESIANSLHSKFLTSSQILGNIQWIICYLLVWFVNWDQILCISQGFICFFLFLFGSSAHPWPLPFSEKAEMQQSIRKEIRVSLGKEEYI